MARVLSLIAMLLLLFFAFLLAVCLLLMLAIVVFVFGGLLWYLSPSLAVIAGLMSISLGYAVFSGDRDFDVLWHGDKYS